MSSKSPSPPPEPSPSSSSLGDILREHLARHPEIVSSLREHEARVDSECPPLQPADVTVLSTIARLEADLKSARAEAARLRSCSSAQASMSEDASVLLLRESLRARCVPLIIGGRHGIDPSSLDIHVDTDSSGHQIAWIPVPIWPLPIRPDGARGSYTVAGVTRPVYEIGKTQIRESLSTINLHPLRGGAPRPFTVTGYAVLNLSTLTPAEISARLEARSRSALDELNSPSSDLSSEIDEPASQTSTSPSLHDAPLPHNQDLPFIPSHVRPSSPLSNRPLVSPLDSL